jgi:hypothetical protein
MFQLPSEFHPLLLYQFTVPADAVADKSTVPESQRCAGTGLIITGIAVTATTVFWYLMHSQRLLPHKSSSSIFGVTKLLRFPIYPLGLLYQLIVPH